MLGTLGNVIGALIASLMMGVAESLGIQFIGADSGLIVVFMLLLTTLAVRPSGLGRAGGALMRLAGLGLAVVLGVGDRRHARIAVWS